MLAVWGIGAQGLVGDGTETDIAIKANRHPGMGLVYKTYLQ